MPYTLTKPTKKEHHLVITDAEFAVKAPKTKVTIRIADSGDNNIRKDLFAEFTRTYDKDDSVKVTSRVAYGELARKEAFLTLAACNIEDEGKPLFEFEGDRIKDEDAFNLAWNALPPVVTDEIHLYVRENNFQWLAKGK